MRPSLLAIITSCLSHFGQSSAFRYRHQALVYQFLDTFMASMLPIELTVHSQTSYPLDTILRSKRLSEYSIVLLPCTAFSDYFDESVDLYAHEHTVPKVRHKAMLLLVHIDSVLCVEASIHPIPAAVAQSVHPDPKLDHDDNVYSTRRHTNTSSAAPCELRCC